MIHTEFRMVRQLRILRTGAGGVIVEHEQVRYVLQFREGALPWRTVPEVDFESLSISEKATIIDAEERARPEFEVRGRWPR